MRSIRGWAALADSIFVVPLFAVGAGVIVYLSGFGIVVAVLAAIAAVLVSIATGPRKGLDFLRMRMTSGLEVSTSGEEVRRGEEVEALVTITGPRRLGNVEAGLLCTEYYDEEQSSTDSEGRANTYRVTCDAIAHKTWLPVENAAGVQSVRLMIPPLAPFSYKGDCLSFKWEVVARGRRPRRLDAQARHDFFVLP